MTEDRHDPEEGHAHPRVLRDETPPYFTVPHRLLDEWSAGLDVYAIAVYVGLRSYAWKGDSVYPSQSTLARQLGMGRSSVARAYARLQEAGLIRVDRRFDPENGRELSAMVTLLWPPSQGGTPYSHRHTPLFPQTYPPIPTDTQRKPREENQGKKTPPTPSEGDRRAATKKDQRDPGNPSVVWWSDRFDAFWAAYPRKEKKPLARTAWMKVPPADRDFDAIMAGLTRWKASDQWARDVIQHPTTWLNQRQWEDEPRPAAQVRRANGRPEEAPVPERPPDTAPAAVILAWLTDPASARHPEFRGADGQRRRREEIERYQGGAS